MNNGLVFGIDLEVQWKICSVNAVLTIFFTEIFLQNFLVFQIFELLQLFCLHKRLNIFRAINAKYNFMFFLLVFLFDSELSETIFTKSFCFFVLFLTMFSYYSNSSMYHSSFLHKSSFFFTDFHALKNLISNFFARFLIFLGLQLISYIFYHLGFSGFSF